MGKVLNPSNSERLLSMVKIYFLYIIILSWYWSVLTEVKAAGD
jgi:hypothetical protein